MTERVTLAYLGLIEPEEHFLVTCGQSVIELDLSHNKIADLKFLSSLPSLNSLVLDHNRISSHTKMTLCPTLETLWVNHNRIDNLGIFITTLRDNCPNLKILSMMNNIAAPSYFNGGTYQQYTDYRYFVISHMTKLQILDDTKITPTEISEARRLHPPLSLSRTKRRSKSRHSISSKTAKGDQDKTRRGLKPSRSRDDTTNNHNNLIDSGSVSQLPTT